MSKQPGQGITVGLTSRAAINVLRLHRLTQFQETFNKYLAGEVSAVYVKIRAKKMLAIGLPKLK